MMQFAIIGPKQSEFRSYNTINYCEKILEGLTQEEVDSYHVGFGKLYSWLRRAIEGRKSDITRRKAFAKQSHKNRENKIKDHEDRTIKKTDYLTAEEERFKESNRENFEAFEKQQAELEAKAAQEYGEEIDDEGSQKEEVELIVLNTWDKNEAEAKFDEENPQVEIPEPIEDDIDNDWILTEDELEAQIATFWSKAGLEQ